MTAPALIARNRAERGRSPVDLFTPLHFAVGFIAGVLGVSPTKASLVFVATKVAVASLEEGSGHALFGRGEGESNMNQLCDLLAEIGGVDLGARIRNKWNPEPDAFVNPPAPAVPSQAVQPAPAPATIPAAAGIFG